MVAHLKNGLLRPSTAYNCLREEFLPTDRRSNIRRCRSHIGSWLCQGAKRQSSFGAANPSPINPRSV
jgi:hypothetical protein